MAKTTDIAALYDRWAGSYDADANRTRDLAGEVLRRELGGVAAGDVVELGCGTGRNTVWLVERARRVVAVDFSPRMLERARARIPGDRVRFLQHDIRAPLPLEVASADLVVIALVLEHVEAVGAVLAESARVLRPSGAVFVCELHPYRQWEGATAEFTDADTGEHTRVPAHLHGTAELVNAGIDAGLRAVRLGEWRDATDEREGRPPRLLSVLYAREA